MGKLNNITILLVGASGSGKSTVADHLHNECGYDVLQSYTTRPRRTVDETGHIFVTEEEYEAIPNKVATTYFDGHYYCATQEQVDNNDIYIIDPHGVDEVLSTYKGNKKLIVFYIDVSIEERLNRMRMRGDSEDSCWQRLRHDEAVFAPFVKTVFNSEAYIFNGLKNSTALAMEIKNVAENIDCEYKEKSDEVLYG